MINAEQHFAPNKARAENSKRPARRSSSPVKIPQHRLATWWARHVGVCLRTITRRIDSGEIHPVIRLSGRRILIPEPSMERFLTRIGWNPNRHETATR